jgi:hypothetical protein
MTNTKTFNLIELKDRFDSKQINVLSSQKHEITLDNKHDISLIQLLTHNGKEYFGFLNEATNLDKSFWVDDETHYVTISALELELEEETETSVEETSVEETSVEETSVEETSVEETSVEETSVDINAVVELCSQFSGIELLELCQKLQTIALKKIKTENKKTTKKNKTQTSKSDKNFNYFTLLSSWYNSALSAREIASDSELSNGYGAATIAEDMRVIKVLLGGDKLLQISKEWADYIVDYWSENSDTAWYRLHYAFAKEGRKCNDLDILCNYVIDNGVTKDDVKNAIASQN